jgi:formiminoglutamase
MYKPPNMDLWTGRIDAEQAVSSLRWHQCVTPLAEEQTPGIALLGVETDEGVRRNHGRAGAAAGPDAIRRALANQAYHLDRPVYDAGTLCCKDGDLEALQAEQAIQVQQFLDSGHFPLLLGGGHEIAFGSFLGLQQHLASTGQDGPIGIINLDAHFDLRRAEHATSGTPFLQMAEHCQGRNMSFHYCCLGLSEVANTAALFAEADRLGVLYCKDEELASWQLPLIEQRLAEFLQPCQAIYLSIDLDVLSSATVPGVSAPASRGVSLAVLEQLLTFIRRAAADRLKIADIAEYNPKYDIDDRSAKVAARLCHLLTR